MKNKSVHLFIFSVVLCSIIVNVLSQAKQRNMYEVYLQGFGNCPGKQTVIDASSLQLNKVNSSAISVDGTVKVTQDLPNDTTVSVKAFMQINKKYARSAVTSSEANICQFIQDGNIYWSLMQKQTNLPDKCPFTKGVYKASKAVVNVVKMPSMLPFGCWKMELSFMNSQNKEIACIYGIAKVTQRNKAAVSQCSPQ